MTPLGYQTDFSAAHVLACHDLEIIHKQFHDVKTLVKNLFGVVLLSVMEIANLRNETANYSVLV